MPSLPSVAPAPQAETRKTPARKTAAAPAPVKAPVAKKAAARKPAASAATVTVTVPHILNAAPALKSGEPQPLGEIAKLLRDAKLLGRNASSTKVFNKHLQDFELMPARQPNQVRYLLNGRA